MLTGFFFAQGAAGGGGNNEVVLIVYVLTGVSLIIGFAAGTYKYVQRQKQKWTDEGVSREKQSQAMVENTKQMMKNTEAIDKLTGEFTRFAMSVRQEMDGMVERIGQLELWRHSNQNSSR
jgi:uncharacterized protein HemX